MMGGRVLLLTQVLPYPPDSGPKVKTWNTLRWLSRRHAVTLASFVRGDQAPHVRQLQQYCEAVHTVSMARGLARDLWHLAASVATREPFFIRRDRRAAMHALVTRLLAQQRFDVVHVDQLNMAPYAARATRSRRLLDAHNALWLLYQRLWQTAAPGPVRWLLAREWPLLKRYEGRVCREFPAVLAVSAGDAAALQEAAGGGANITVVPIVLDTEAIRPVARRRAADHVVHLGTMYWPPNADGVRWFIEAVLPHIQACRPGVTFDVVGARPPRQLRALAARRPGINVVGYVDDPTPYLERAGVMVVPLRAGGGMRVKILNALAQGVPIVSTRVGCEGIAVTAGVDALIADDARAFADAVLRLLGDPELGERLARNGRRLVEDRYDLRHAQQSLDAVYDALLFEHR